MTEAAPHPVRRRLVARSGLIVVLSVVLALSVLCAVTLGSADLSVTQVYEVLLYKLTGIGDPVALSSGPVHDIVWFIRLPRTVLAIGVGMGLAVSGVVMQAIVRNPLADPYILGVSSGASLGATAAIMLGVGAALGSNAIGVFAFLGALGISVLVQVVASIGQRASSIRLLLAGMALSAVCGALTNFVIFIANNKEGLGTITFWLMGSLADAKWENIVIILPCMVLVTGFFISQHRVLNLMLLGDDEAITLGVDLLRFRHVYLVLSALMVGLAVYCAGMIGFVGLIVPHVVRMFVGTNHRLLVAVSALVGAIFLIWADVACRLVIPGSEMPIGILVSLIGAPAFIYLLARHTYGFGGGA